MSHLMSHGYMGHCRGDMLAIVHQGYDASVEALETTTVVLEKHKLLMECNAFLILGKNSRIED